MVKSRNIVVFTGAAQVQYLPRIRYVLDFLTKHPAAPAPGVAWLLNPDSVPEHAPVIRYGMDGEVADDWVLPAQGLLFGADLPNFRTLIYNSYSFNFKDFILYSVAQHAAPQQDFIQQDASGSARFAFDWIEMLFFHLSRIEEYHLSESDMDEHGVAKAAALFLPRQGLHHIPVVDQLVVCIYQALGFEVVLQPTVWSLTHDADHLHFFSTPMRLLRFLVGSFWHWERFRVWPSLIRRYIHREDPYHTFEMMLSDRPQLRKVIYIPSGIKRHQLDPSLRFDDPAARGMLALARERGYVVGVHPGYDTWRNAGDFNEDVCALEAWTGQSIRYTRQHFLHFHFPDTCDLIEQSALDDDSTLGYRTAIGFRCGTGFSYHLYNFGAEQPYTWLETPLVMMDIALLREAGFDTARALALWEAFVKANLFGTQVTLLFHNSIFFEAELRGASVEALYRQIIRIQ